MNIRIEKAVVTGGRDFADAARIEADLRALMPLGLRRVAVGDCGIPRDMTDPRFDSWVPTHSADALALHAALRVVRVAEGKVYQADWDEAERKTGRRNAAGPIRNEEMLAQERPDLVLAYPDPESRGTWDCVKKALLRGHTVAVWGWDDGPVVGHLRGMTLDRALVSVGCAGRRSVCIAVPKPLPFEERKNNSAHLMPIAKALAVEVA